MDVTLTIVDTAETLALNALILRGFDDVDEVRMVMPVESMSTGGYRRSRALGFQRVITLGLGVVTDAAKQAFLVRWVHAFERSLTCGAETARVSLLDAARVKADTSSGKLFHRFALQLLDRTVRLDAPYSWQEAPVTWTSWAQTNIRPFGDTDYTFESLP